MERVHLFELADLAWYPRTLADAGTAYLRTLQAKVGVAQYLVPLATRGLAHSPTRRIVDLCAGGGGPTPDLVAALPERPELLLTDLHPNRASLEELVENGVSVHPTPVDARAVPAELTGLRTIFNALHHLQPDDARAVFRDAQAAGQPIFMAEVSERSFLSLTIGSAPIPLFVWLMMPMVRPVRLSWLLLTYGVPLLPLTIAWDGWVSQWRTYSLAEQEALVAPLQRENWIWEMGQLQAGPGRITWLLGYPRAAATSPA